LIRSLGSNLGIAFQIALGELYYGDFHANFRSFDRIKKVTAADVQRVANEYLNASNRTVAYRVQTEAKAGAEEQIDEKALMQWVQSLPQEEKMAIFQKFQTLRTQAEQEAYGKELWERAKAAQVKK
jgi:hypothetical protein